MESKRGEFELNKKELKEVTSRKITYLMSKDLIDDFEVYSLVKDFFRLYLNLNYEFTFAELESELKNVYLNYDIRSELFTFLNSIGYIEYTDYKFNQKELKELLESFVKIVDSLIIGNILKQKSRSETRLLAKIFHVSSSSTAKDSSTAIAKAAVEDGSSKAFSEMSEESLASRPSFEVPEGAQVGSKEADPESSPDELKSKIELLYMNLNKNDIDAAQNLYKSILAKYEALDEAKKAEYFEDINKIYASISQIETVSESTAQPEPQRDVEEPDAIPDEIGADKPSDWALETPKSDPEYSQDEPEVDIPKLIEVIEMSLAKNDVATAKSVYKDLQREYEELDEKEKQQYFEEINKFYSALSS